ncbi:biotin-dependent carboxyltransferase family protein [Rhodobacteraceae bacterium D3-12]|nr:biotin-dependent carboxyltransferase family protein [Rhodobacteraceae bacterium D3-12]
MTRLTIHRAGPAMTVQDLGRTGTLKLGLSRGGAADRLAILEATALLGCATPVAAIEMAGMGGRFSVDAPTRFALTGAPMRATLDGTPLVWGATYLLPPGAMLDIGPATAGVYGYLSFAGGVMATKILGSRATHLTAGIGKLLQTDGTLALGEDPSPDTVSMKLDVQDRFSGGDIRLMQGPQTSLYSSETRERFCQTTFRRSPHANRQGVRLDHDGAPFQAVDQLGIVSDVIVPGDIQMTGDGIPFVLLPECQTVGGYPRIGAVIPADLPRVAQAAPGAELRFSFISLDDVDSSLKTNAAQLKELRSKVEPMLRDPHDIADLLSYQLISGATAGDDLERP